MARQKAPDPPEDDVPAWVMTFSDVITLLMTFFILLLTFATNETETFDRMRVSAFGGGGSSGIAGEKEGMEKDALLVRERARSGRIAQDGSETPPIYSDPSLSSLDRGIAGLESEEYREVSKTHRLVQSLGSLFENGELSAKAKQHMLLLSKQIRARRMHIELFVHDHAIVPQALQLVQLLEAYRVSPISIGVGVEAERVTADKVMFVLVDQGAAYGSED